VDKPADPIERDAATSVSCAADAGGPPREKPASLARRVGTWTTRGLLCGLIAVAALGFGRQVLRWWAVEEPVAIAGDTVGKLGDFWTPHRLDLAGQAWSLVRQSVAGSRDEALLALRKAARRYGRDAPAPPAPPGPGELGLLDSLGGQTPVDQAGDAWRLYALEAGVPMVVGVRIDKNPTCEGSMQRIVCWGMLIPFAGQSWTLYIFVTAEAATGTEARVPIPPDGEVVLSLCSEGGEGMVAFRGAGPVDRWKGFYERWAQGHGYAHGAGWHDAPAGPVARFHLAGAADGPRLDVQLLREPSGRARGLVVLTPAANRGDTPPE